MALSWNDSLRTGLTWQDTQHQALFATVDELLEAMYRKEDSEKLGAQFEQVRAGFAKHFSGQEQFMRRMLSPGFTEHKAAHDKFLESLMPIKQKLGNLSSKAILDIQFMFSSWMRTHILSMDRAVASNASNTQAK
jgi:hemerythrin